MCHDAANELIDWCSGRGTDILLGGNPKGLTLSTLGAVLSGILLKGEARQLPSFLVHVCHAAAVVCGNTVCVHGYVYCWCDILTCLCRSYGCRLSAAAVVSV